MFESLLVAVVGLNVWADFTDRRAASRSDASALSLWTTIVQFILVMPLVGLVGQITPAQTLVCAVVGAFTALARAPWYRALSMPGQKLSSLTPFTRISSVIVLVLAFTLLGEEFSVDKFLGALLMVAGALIVSLNRSFTSFRDYLVGNRAIVLVLIFACSLAAISVFYKYMINAGVPMVTTYFFLKLFQCASAVAFSAQSKSLGRSFSAIQDLQLFVQARALQTLAAFLYLFVLRHVDLSTVEPIAAAISPILYFSIDKISELRAGKTHPDGAGLPTANRQAHSDGMAILGLAATAVGLYFVVRA
ncbi:MAG: hypothetical protein AB7S70_00775 [Hyphomicrobium sp.]|uniref:EamA family transporter n=1 Tax=Hyphomicrobium sp. TaxID=82 RepID=UPI003D11D149